MKKPLLPRIDIRAEEIERARKPVEQYSGIINQVVDEIIAEPIHDLDECIRDIQAMLRNPADLSIDELNYYIGYLPTLIYFVGDSAEKVGIMADSSSTIRKEKYDNLYMLATGKTIPDKQSETSKLVMNESVVEAAYKRAYKKIQSRIEVADKVLNSLKKVLQWRISELEVTGQNGNGGTFNVKNAKGTSNRRKNL